MRREYPQEVLDQASQVVSGQIERVASGEVEGVECRVVIGDRRVPCWRLRKFGTQIAFHEVFSFARMQGSGIYFPTFPDRLVPSHGLELFARVHTSRSYDSRNGWCEVEFAKIPQLPVRIGELTVEDATEEVKSWHNKERV